MKERPILFNGPMVRAILEGRKTQTRRIAEINDRGCVPGFVTPDAGWAPRSLEEHRSYCPLGIPGDRLWVRETWQPLWADIDHPPESLKNPEGWQIGYPATDGVQEWHDEDRQELSQACRPSIHMPRWASRILLEVVAVRVERIQDISEANARAEGVDPVFPPGVGPAKFVLGFRKLWSSVCGAKSWNSNPWVWVVEFKRLQLPEVQP